MKNVTRSIRNIVAVVGVLLLIPLTLQLTIGSGVDGQGFNWKLNDFLAMGVLLLFAGLVIEIVRKSKIKKKMIATTITVGVFLLLWAHLAVGIVNDWPLAGS